MDKYLKAIEKAEEQIRITRECILNACKETGMEYTIKDARLVSSKAYTMLQGIKLVATYDYAIGGNEWNEIAKKCKNISDVYEREYESLLQNR